MSDFAKETENQIYRERQRLYAILRELYSCNEEEYKKVSWQIKTDIGGKAWSKWFASIEESPKIPLETMVGWRKGSKVHAKGTSGQKSRKVDGSRQHLIGCQCKWHKNGKVI